MLIIELKTASDGTTTKILTKTCIKEAGPNIYGKLYL